MYDYRLMTNDERQRVIDYRRRRNLPKHSPPHWAMGFSGQYLVTAACFEHAPIVGKSIERLTECEQQLLTACEEHTTKIYGWCVLPNHYHVLVGTQQIKSLCKTLGRFHGRSSFTWNAEDEQRGTKGLVSMFRSRDSIRASFLGYAQLRPSQSRSSRVGGSVARL